MVLTVQEHAFLVHSKILSERNAEFKKIINRSFKENDAFSYINIPNGDRTAFHAFLEFLYTGKVFEWTVSTELMKLADEFNDSKLNIFCEHELLRTLRKDTVVDVLIAGIECQSYNLQEQAINFIVSNYDKIRELESYRKLLQNAKAAHVIIIKVLNDKHKRASMVNFQHKKINFLFLN